MGMIVADHPFRPATHGPQQIELCLRVDGEGPARVVGNIGRGHDVRHLHGVFPLAHQQAATFIWVSCHRSLSDRGGVTRRDMQPGFSLLGHGVITVG